MVLRGLVSAHHALAGGGGAALNVRADYGTGILPSLFGAVLARMDPASDTLPPARPIGAAACRAHAAAGVPDDLLDRGVWPLVRGFAATWTAIASRYPRIGAHVAAYHPDLQGPIDVVELL